MLTFPPCFLMKSYLIISASLGGTPSCPLYSILNSPSPEVNPLNSVANPNICDKGTSAYIINKSPLLSVLVTSPLLLLIEAMTFP